MQPGPDTIGSAPTISADPSERDLRPSEPVTRVRRQDEDERVTDVTRVKGAPVTFGSAPTRVQGESPSAPGAVDAQQTPLEEKGFDHRYAARAVLGEGGMGEVRLCKDARIGRDVAMKVIRPGVGSRSDVRARFEREARVQGQLEHPSIVPVYDLGIAPDGTAYFTMKRLRGHTFEEIVRGLDAGDDTFTGLYGTRKLLQAFTQVCLAIAFAHARGVLHRDLKPSNVMLGDFGEVYVLDWGLAKIRDAADLPVDSESVISSDPGGATVTGAVMGTPGYMAPEQVRGEVDKLDARTDVYALGAILFEALTWQPLHTRSSSTEAVLIATVQGVDARPSVRTPERAVPPELEAICVQATATNPEERFASVREMSDAIERYLDGDRDTERRRVLAASHVDAAAAHVARGDVDPSARGEAIRELSRALALDPSHDGAIGMMMKILLEPPKEVPSEAQAELDASIEAERRTGERVGAWAYMSWFVAVPFIFWQGMRSWGCWLTVAALILLSASLSWWGGRTTPKRPLLFAFSVLVVSTVALGMSGLHLSPFMVVPGMAATNTLMFAMHAKKGAQRKLTIAIGALAVLLPFVLELVGLLQPSFAFRDGAMVLLPRLAHLPMVPTLAFLLVASTAVIVIPAVMVGRLHDESQAAKQRVFLHLWQLRQFVPHEAKSGAAMPAAPPPESHDCHFSAAVARVRG